MTIEVKEPEPGTMSLRFHEITAPERQCRLCNLVKTNPSLVFLVHELYRRGAGIPALRTQCEDSFAAAGVTLPQRSSFQKHLQQHCSIVKGADTEAGGGEETDYFELRKLYRQILSVWDWTFREFARVTGKQKGGTSLTDQRLQSIVKLAAELRQILKTLSDLRNSERLVAVALARHTERLVHSLAEPLGVTLRDVRDRLVRGEDAQEIAADLDRKIHGELFPLFETIAGQTLEQSKEHYKLH